MSLFVIYDLSEIINHKKIGYNNFVMTSKHIGGYIISMSDVLGCGSFGKVYKGIKTTTKQEVAIKIITKSLIDSNPYLKASLNNQIKIFQTVSSENILGFMDVMESPNNYYIVSQLCDRDLSQIIKANPRMPEKDAIQIVRQICCGLLALVREGITHRDLKPANIMVQGKTYKLGDFGFSKQTNYIFKPQSGQATGMMETVVGTPLYMSLQILKGHQYTSKCDIWALGLIFYEMLHGETPWKGNSQYELIRNIEKKPLNTSRKDLSPQTIDFLKRCLQLQQVDRISWNELFVHPIFDNYFLSMADQNKEYQNQMKAIMTKLRFYFDLNKGQLQLYLSKYGFMSKDQDLNFQKYFEFLRAVNPTISEQQAKYIFKKTDADNSGAISLDQILTMLKIYGIDLQQENSLIKTQSKDSSQKQIKQQSTQELTDADISDFKARAAQRLKEVFVKLHKIIIRNNLSLKKVFHDFDKQKKGNLNYIEFKVMLQKMCKDISDEQAMMAFQIIDQDGSNSLQFEEISKHYKLINQLN